MNSFKRISDCYLQFCQNGHDLKNSEYFKKFIALNHSIGNFIPVPFKYINNKKSLSFNVKRNSTLSDYWDLTLFNICQLYLTNQEKYLNKLAGSSDELKKIVKEWLGKFGEGKDGFKNFINKNYLTPFININYNLEPIIFWEGHLDSVAPKCAKQCEDFFKIVSEKIELRGKNIAEILKGKLKTMTNDEIIKILGVDKIEYKY